MSRDVTTFVIRVDGEVKTHQFNKVFIGFVTQELGEVVRVILISFNGRKLAILVDVAVDTTSNVGELGNQIHGILKGRIPVLRLVNTRAVSLGELGFVLKSVDGKRELRHGVKGLGTAVNDFFNKGRKRRTSSPFGRESLDLFFSGDFTGDKQPEERLRKRLTTFLGSRKSLLAFGDGHTTETDTFFGVKNRTFPDKTLDTTHTTVNLINSDFTKNLGTIFLLESLDLGLLFGDKLSKTFLQGLQDG